MDTSEPPGDFITDTQKRLAGKIMGLVPGPGRFPTAIDGLFLTCRNRAGQTGTCFYAPAISVIVQGRKESVIGREKLSCGELNCLVSGVGMPSASRILAASPDVPLLAVSLSVNQGLVTEIAAEISPVAKAAAGRYLGVSAARVTPDVLGAFWRLVNLLDKPEQRPFMAPLVIREIIIRVLLGPQGAALRMIYTPGPHSVQVAGAIAWLRKNYAEPLRMEALAERVGLAPSTFYRQFRKVTSLSPLQFQKCLRLGEAQRLMLAEALDANSAGRAVGYENAQQFSREYKRLFGDPPHRSVNKMRHK